MKLYKILPLIVVVCSHLFCYIISDAVGKNGMVVSSKIDFEISKLQAQFSTQYCLVNPFSYIASVRPKSIGENKLVFLLGSYLWGSI